LHQLVSSLTVSMKLLEQQLGVCREFQTSIAPMMADQILSLQGSPVPALTSAMEQMLVQYEDTVQKRFNSLGSFDLPKTPEFLDTTGISDDDPDDRFWKTMEDHLPSVGYRQDFLDACPLLVLIQ
jgi:hypothetical protein